MINRSIAGLALAALIALPTIAMAQTPAPSGMMKSSSMMTKPTKSQKKMALKKTGSVHAKKDGPAQSTVPGAPTYSGSSGTGK